MWTLAHVGKHFTFILHSTTMEGTALGSLGLQASQGTDTRGKSNENELHHSFRIGCPVHLGTALSKVRTVPHRIRVFPRFFSHRGQTQLLFHCLGPMPGMMQHFLSGDAGARSMVHGAHGAKSVVMSAPMIPVIRSRQCQGSASHRNAP